MTQRLAQILLFAVIIALFWSATSYAQVPGPTLARSGVVQTWTTDTVRATRATGGNGTVVHVGIIPPTTVPVRLSWERVLEITCYAYENRTHEHMGVQNGATAALHYIKVNGQIVDGIGSWRGWANHIAEPFDGVWDWRGPSGKYAFSATSGPPAPRSVVLPPSNQPRMVTYVLGTAITSTTWPIPPGNDWPLPGYHQWPIVFKALAAVRISWQETE